eukprot:Plantae.Rhodophyta-Purpureofilum_apyrenoidigerum.ctg26231.p1 GENE.Plantae.Rhodophyta-Purpureofilum_apyrenoidigerum.ctg26231~~Plantae.Rhodophyta-Purpureofilum_apyrenoidigerum.ctg26231.p1  ORF type:complete len:290 (-),score=28.21 Plantae.Rhodophyta-Purpureofilum_apyrenoidigerum.ctg26231:130-999(-)
MMDAMKDIVAGTIAGSAGVLLGQPLDVIRVRAQTTWASKQQSLIFSAVQMARNEGLRSFYKGVVPPMAGVAAQHAALFLAYGSILRLLATDTEGREKHQPLALKHIFVAGCVGGFISSFVTSPIELLKVRQQVYEARESPSMMTVARRTVEAEGPRGLLRGLRVTIFREIPAYGGFFLAYEAIKRALANSLHVADDEMPAWTIFLSGATAGVLSWIPIYPIDVVKSRLQVESSTPGGVGILSCVRSVYRTGGLKAFFHGFGPTIARAFPVDGFILLTFESCLRYMSNTT